VLLFINIQEQYFVQNKNYHLIASFKQQQQTYQSKASRST